MKDTYNNTQSRKTTINALLITVVLFLSIGLNDAFAASRYAVATGNWNSTATWATTSGGTPGATVPAASDVVFIENGWTVTVTASTTCGSLTFQGTNTTNSLVVNSSFVLTVTNAVTLNQVVAANTGCTITGAGSLTCASVSVGITPDPTTGTNGVTYTNIITSSITSFNVTGNMNLYAWQGNTGTKLAHPQFLLQSGTLNVDGQIIGNFETTACLATFSMATGAQTGTLLLMGATPFPAPGVAGTFTRTLNGTSATVNYDLAGVQTVFATTYTNLTLSGSGNKTFGTNTINGKLSLQGTAAAITTAPTYGAASTLEYKGSALQTATAIAFPATNGPTNLIIDNAAGVTLPAAFPRTITGTVTLTAGILTTVTGSELTVNNTSSAAITGASTTRYISGPLVWSLATGSTYTFPVGKGGTYYPFGLTSITGTAPVIKVEAFNANTGGTANAPLTTLSATEYWSTSISSGTFSGGSVSLTRQIAIGTMTAIGRSATQGGAYSNLNGTVSGTSIITSDNTGASLGFFAMAVKTTAPATLTISNPTTAVTAANICALATKVPIHAVNITADGSTGTGTLTNFQIVTTGTYLVADITNFKIWYNTTNDLGTATLLSTKTPVTTAGTQTFPAFTLNIPAATTYYLWVTMDAAATVVDGRTIAVNGSASTDMTTTLTKAGGPTSASGAQTFIVTPATPGTITGTTPQCPALAGQTYSITAVPNATTYNWTVPTGWSITAGAGTTSITVTTGSAGQGGNITVTAGNSCGTSAASSLAVTVDPAIPATPGAITGTATQCPAITGQVYNISAVTDATTYTWTVPTGWSITAGAGTTSITVTTGSAGQNGNITVTAGNTCGTSSASSKGVTVSPATPATPGAITGTTPQCPALAGQIYSISAVTDATAYTWTVPTGWSITAGAGTTSITVTIGAAGQNGNITVTAGNSCGTSAVSSKAVTVDPSTPATPGAISGSATVTPSTPGLVYSITAVTDATTYTWTVPAGWSITAGQGTISIIATSDIAGGNITVTAGNSCGTSAASSLAVTVATNNCPASTAVAPAATQTRCQGVAASLLSATVTLSGGSGTPTKLYQWYYNTTNSNTVGGATLIAAATLSTYTPLTGAPELGTRYYFCVGYATDNSCAQTNATQSLASNTVQITVNPLTPATPGTITGTTPQCPALAGQTYSITAVADATTYTWSVPTGWSITAGAGTTSITVTTGTTGQDGNITVTAGNSCGTSAASSKAVTVNSATPATPGAISGSASVAASTAGFVYSISAVPNATTYAWTVPTGWSITAGAGTTSITVTSGVFGQNGNITVTAGNSCGTSAASSLAVTVLASNCPASTSVAPSATQTLCQSAAASQLTITITLSGGSGTPTNLYQWYYNTTNSNTIAGATLIAAATASTYTPLTGAPEVGSRYYFCVGYATNNGCGQSNSTQSLASNTVQVTVNSPDITSQPVNRSVCTPAATTFSVTASGTPGYQWQMSSNNSVWVNASDGTPSGVSYTNATTATLGVTGGSAVSLYYYRCAVTSGGCTNYSNSATLTISTVPGAAGTITGNSGACQNQNGVAYSVPSISGATTYTWSYSGAGATFSSNPSATQNITIDFSGAATSGNLTVRGTNACGNGTVSTNYAIAITTGVPGAAGSISGSAAVFQTQTGVPYSVAAIAGASSYLWSYSAMGMTFSNSTQSITAGFNLGATSGNLTVMGVNGCGNGTTSPNFAILVVASQHNACTACHITVSAPGASLTAVNGNPNLCISCHNPGGTANAKSFSNADKAIPGVSGNSHAWGAPSINAARQTNSPTTPEMAAKLKNDSIMCSTCHDQHSQTYTKFLRADNTGNALCKDCHSASNVGRYRNNGANKGSHPVGLTYSGTGSLLAAPTDSVLTVNGKIECSSCHQLHYAKTNDGNLLRATKGNSMCLKCHNAVDHHGMGCLTCHQVHNTNKSNIFMIRNVITGPGAVGNKTVVFTDTIGPNSAADGDGTYDGICEVCHTTNASNRHLNSAGGDHAHHVGEKCWTCHSHASGFAVITTTSCVACHDKTQGVRPQIVGTGGEFDKTSKHTNIAPTDADCKLCHNETDHQMGTIKLNNADDNTVWAGTMNGFCLVCHDANVTPAIPTGVVFPGGDPKYNKSNLAATKHQTNAGMGSNSCIKCHNDHGSPYSNLITTGASNYLHCYSCHKSGGLAATMIIDSANTAVPGVSGNTHAFNVNAINATYQTVTPTDAGMLAKLEGGKIVCSTCHDPHDNTNAPMLRMSNTTNQLCKDCHSPRNVGKYVTDNINNRGSHPVGIAYPGTSDYSAGHTLPLVAGQVECSTCHAVHNAITNDGNLLKMANTNALCTDCHTYTTHSSKTCLDCHEVHGGTSNIYLLKDNIATKATVFTAQTGANSFSDGDATIDGVCEVCHTVTNPLTTAMKATPGASGTSHNWDVAASGSYEVNAPTNPEMAARVYGGKITCVTCHNQHSDAIGKALRVTATGDAICKDCHSARNVGTYAAIPATNKGSHPVGVAYSAVADGFKTITNTKILTPAGNVECTSCHGVHDSKGTLGLTNDGNVLRDTKGQTLCNSCHTYSTHQSMLCSACHATHNPNKTNIMMVPSTVTSPLSGTDAVVFTARTGANSYSDGDATINGICEVCHTVSNPLTTAMKATPGTSGSSHNWDVTAVNATYEVNTPSNSAMAARVTAAGGKMTCIVCHDQHSDANAKALRVTATGDAICKDCHSARNVGAYASAPATNKGSHPVGVVYSAVAEGFKTITNTKILTPAGNVECTSCHGVHDSKGLIGLTNDGNVLRDTKGQTLCNSCHTYSTHQGMLCAACHQTHNSNKTNIMMVPSSVTSPLSGTDPVTFTARTGANSYSDGDATINGICEVCHTVTNPLTTAMKATPGGTGTSHNWDVTAVNGTYEVNTPSNSAMAARLEGGKITCITCHDQHSDANAKALRVTATGDAICKDCHAARNVGSYASAPATNKGSHPVGVTYSAVADGYKTITNTKILTPASKVECSSCHGVHDSKGTIGLTNDGNVLRDTKGQAFCNSCHTYSTHQGMLCAACHQTHNSNKTNILMVPGTVTSPLSGTDAVVFTSRTGAKSFSDGDATIDGICEVCHTVSNPLTTAMKATPGTSGTSHNWDVNAVNATYEVNTPSNTAMAARVSAAGGKMTCIVCHDQHSDANAKALRVTATGDAICKDCHAARNVGMWVTLPATNKGSHPVGVTYPVADPTRFLAAPASPMIAPGGKVECSSCHGVHDSKGLIGLTNDGNLLRTTNNAALCTKCHTYTSHQGMDCLRCHDTHNSNKGNIMMIRDVITGPGAVGDKAVVFTARTGAGSFADGAAPYNGVCEVCHTLASSAYHSNSAPGTHKNGENCVTTCHPHNGLPPLPAPQVLTSFPTGTCHNCHERTAPGDPQLYPATGAHAKHCGTLYEFKCSECHWGAGNNATSNPTWPGESPHSSGTANVIFNPTGLASRGGLDIPLWGTPTWNSGTKTCSNIYCHSNGRSAVRGTDGVTPWSNTRTSQLPTYTNPVWTGTITACTSCHGGKGNMTSPYTITTSPLSPNAHLILSYATDAPTSGLHTHTAMFNDSQDITGPTGAGAVQCYLCHNTNGVANNGTNYQGTYGSPLKKHVDGQTYFKHALFANGGTWAPWCGTNGYMAHCISKPTSWP